MESPVRSAGPCRRGPRDNEAAPGARPQHDTGAALEISPVGCEDRTASHFMGIIVVIFFWGTALGGILGMILAIPLTAFRASLWRPVREEYIPEII